jgi:hypothetical protein
MATYLYSHFIIRVEEKNSPEYQEAKKRSDAFKQYTESQGLTPFING